MTRYKKNSFPMRLLKAIAVGGVVILAASNPFFGLRLIQGIKRDLRNKKWRDFYRDLYRLKKQRKISVQQLPDGKYEVTLLHTGQKLVERYDIDCMSITKPEKWDGFWRFCSFDIPSKKKDARQALLSKLKELGFIMVQNSLWAHPYECRQELFAVTNAFEVGGYAHFFVAHDFYGQEKLIHKFKTQNRVQKI